VSDAVREGLADPDPRRRVEALDTLAIADAEALDPADLADARRALADPEPPVRFAALEALGSLCLRGVVDAGERRACLEATLRLVGDPEDRVRAELAVALALIDAEPGEPTLGAVARLAEDEAVIVRREAAAALGDLGGRTAHGALSARLAVEDDSEARFELAFALASLGDAAGRALLLEALRSSARRFDACEGLRRLGDPSVVPELQAVLQGWFLPWPERLTVLGTLYALGETTAGPPIVARVEAWRREESIFAIGLIGRHRVREGLPVLTQLAERRRSPLRVHALEALGRLGEPEGLALLDRVAAEPDLSPEHAEAIAAGRSPRDERP
jgi:HEAT repeat protein